jgi:hypothetical protein
LISASPANGLIIVYNYKLYQLHRELNTQAQLIKNPSALHLMRHDKLLAVADDKALSIVDIDKTTVEKHTTGNNNLTRLFKLSSCDGQQPVFAGATTKGLLKIWREVELDPATGALVKKDMDPYRIETLKVLKVAQGGGISQR